jgi:hypothetical protein
VQLDGEFGDGYEFDQKEKFNIVENSVIKIKGFAKKRDSVDYQ